MLNDKRDSFWLYEYSQINTCFPKKSKYSSSIDNFSMKEIVF